MIELTLFVGTFVILGILNWHYICFLLPFWYFGHCLSYLNGYYRHYGGNPDEPIAWGVSSYDKLYNWIWFYNGYHAEHHFRPKVHWTRMQAFRDQIVEQQRAAGVRVIKPPHALGFLDPDLPPHTPPDRCAKSRVRLRLGLAQSHMAAAWRPGCNVTHPSQERSCPVPFFLVRSRPVDVHKHPGACFSLRKKR